MARTVFIIRTQSTTQSPDPELLFTDRLAADFSDVGDPEATAIAAALAAHEHDDDLGDLEPIEVGSSFVAEVGLPGYDAAVSDVGAVTSGIGPAYFYSVTTRRPNGQLLTGTVIAKAMLRDSGADDWDSVTTYYQGLIVKDDGHNWIAKAWPGGVDNLDKKPADHPEYWSNYDISAAERAVAAGITTALDPAYDSGETVATGTYRVDGGISYRSLQDGNVGHTPASSPTWWQAVTGPTGYANELLGGGALTL